jgi:pro-kumamolisin-like protein/Big-like domain-containing protein
MNALWRNIAPALALALAVPLVAAAQGGAASSSVRPRVTDRVDVARLTTLKGNTHPLARAQYDQGAAPSDLPMNRIMLLLQRSPEQESALQDLLTQQQVSSSPNFHKWLTPDQFGQQFGPADADVQAVTSWLASFGFQNIKVSKGRVTIEFSGTASQVEASLHTPIHRYVVNGESHWANANDPQIPAALAPVVAGIVSLHNFRPKPTIRQSAVKLPATIKPGEKPQIDFCTVSQSPCPTADISHDLVPADFNKIYNVSSGMTGAGVTIGIIADTNINVQDINDFRSMFGAPNNPPTIVLNGPDPGIVAAFEGEAVLDATWAGSVAPAATVDLVVSEDTNGSQGTDLSETYIVDNNLADVMTESFSACESEFGAALQNAAFFYGSVAEQAAAQGITYLVASGDGGPDTCDSGTNPVSLMPASVNLLAATPYDVAVGGTMFNDTSNPSTYWSAANGADYESALSYIPEVVWNEQCTVAQCGVDLAGIWSSGGGPSTAFSTPLWQSGVPGIPSTGERFLPDVALNAADHDGYVLCLDGSCEGTNCPPPAVAGQPCFPIASGTSASVQVFGGIMALVDQKLAGRVGNANYTLYKLAGLESYSSCNASAAIPPSTCVFNDVTTGNTNLPGETGFAAGKGYDETTGLGSVNVTNLVNKWNTPSKAAATTSLTLAGGTAPVTLIHGAAPGVAVGITVSPVAPATITPTGEVGLIASGDTSCSFNAPGDLSASLNGGSASFNTECLPGGTYPVHAHYSGDANYLGGNSNSINVTVTPEGSAIFMGLLVVTSTSCNTPTSVTYGSPYVLEALVVPGGLVPSLCFPGEAAASPTGTVTLTDSVNGGPATSLDGGTFHLNSGGWFEDQTIQLPAGTHQITATYQGDNSFSATSTGQSSGPYVLAIGVGQATTTTTVAASPNAPNVNQAVQLTATVSAANSNATASTSQEPTGMVQFFLNGSGSAFGTASVVGNAPGGTFAQSTATLSTTTLPQGNDSITAKYVGDGNYSGSPISPAITVGVGQPGVNVAPCAGATIAINTPGLSGGCQITVTAANSFAGTVTITESVLGVHSGDVDLPTCSFGAPDQNFTPPGTITLSASSTTGTATLTCNTTAASSVMLRPSSRPSGRGWPLAGAALALAGLFLLVTVRRERRWSLVPLAVLLAMVVLAGVSCSGGGSGGTGGGNPGTTPDTYNVTVTATPNSGTAQMTTVAVVVQ